MTQTFQINENNDIFIGNNGKLSVIGGALAVANAVKTVTQSQLGEMVLQMDSGIPNFETIWNGVPNYEMWKSFLITNILKVQGVINVKSLTLQKANNVLSYTATITSIFGTVTVNG